MASKKLNNVKTVVTLATRWHACVSVRSHTVVMKHLKFQSLLGRMQSHHHYSACLDAADTNTCLCVVAAAASGKYKGYSLTVNPYSCGHSAYPGDNYCCVITC